MKPDQRDGEAPGSMECLERWQLLVIEEASSRSQYLVGLGKRTEGQKFYSLSTTLSVKILFCVKFRNQALKGKGREGRSYTQEAQEWLPCLQGFVVPPGDTI